MSQLAQFAASAPDRMDWNSSSTGIKSVSSQLKHMFAEHLGKVIAKVLMNRVARTDVVAGLSFNSQTFHSEGCE